MQTTHPCLSDWVREVQSSGVMTRFHNLPSQSLKKESDIKNYLKEKRKEPLPELVTRSPADKKKVTEK